MKGYHEVTQEIHAIQEGIGSSGQHLVGKGIMLWCTHSNSQSPNSQGAVGWGKLRVRAGSTVIFTSDVASDSLDFLMIEFAKHLSQCGGVTINW